MKDKYKLNIPHKGRMLLIEGIIDINFDDNEILSFSNINKDNIFYDDGVDSYIFTEYAAQTSAAYNGALSDSTDDKRIGFILNIKKAEKLIKLCKNTLQKEISALNRSRAEIDKLFKKAEIIPFKF